MLILIGPSASGKTEVAKILAKKYGISKIVTYTTRAPRVHEVDKVDYNFLSIEEFAKLTEQGFFVETTYYNQNYYGTAKKDIQDNKCVILDPNGLKSFLALNDKRIVSIFLSSSEELRYKRMIDRKDDPELARKRLINDRIAFSEANLSGITYIVDSGEISIDDLSFNVAKVYFDHLKAL